VSEYFTHTLVVADCERPTGFARPIQEIVRLDVAQVPEGRGTFMALTVEEPMRCGAYSRPTWEATADVDKPWADLSLLKVASHHHWVAATARWFCDFWHARVGSPELGGDLRPSWVDVAFDSQSDALEKTSWPSFGSTGDGVDQIEVFKPRSR
jgi:hypothetical protein